MENKAKLVIIGAGIVGCSTAYHLAKLGWRDIVVIDRGPLFATGGSTSHAPGLIFQTNSSKTMTQLAKYTVELYSQLQTAEGQAFYGVGSIEVAHTEARWQELHRKLGWTKSWGIQGAQILTPEQAKEKVPLLNETEILGALYVPTDGIAKAVRAAEALASFAIDSDAAKFYGDTQVLDIEVEAGQVKSVITDKGTITTDKVLVCAGIWGQLIGEMVGEVIPLVPTQHQYVKTAPLSELAGETREVVHPILRHQDKSMYFRQHADCYGIGSYDHEPLLVDPQDIICDKESPMMPSVKQFTESHFETAWQSSVELLPSLANQELPYKINGMMSFTIDGFPVVGESAKVKGFWVAEAVWVTHGGGIGKVVAELLTTGIPSLDVHECDLNRFPEVAQSRKYIWESAALQYDEVYDIHHPRALPKTQYRQLRVSPFYPRLQELGAVFSTSAGWERPQWFESNAKLLEKYTIPERTGWTAHNWSTIQGAEHLATRENVALYDLTGFTKLEVTGKKAISYLQYLCANKVSSVAGKVTYTSMLDANGGIMCDLTITCINPEKFWVITGGAVGNHDLAWMKLYLPQDNSVSIADVSSSYCCVGLWGPLAPKVLSEITNEDVSNRAFPRFTARQIYLGSIPALAVRVSYVGESGWEIYAPTESGLQLWDLLWEAGQPYNIIAAGTYAFNSLRLEKGYLAWGADINTEYDPYEAGLSFAVKPNKGEFIGREALLKRRESPSRKLCYLTLDDPNAVIMGQEPILSQGEILGYVTSADYGYSLGCCIAYAYLPLSYSTPGTKIEIEYFGGCFSATVVDLNQINKTKAKPESNKSQEKNAIATF